MHDGNLLIPTETTYTYRYSCFPPQKAGKIIPSDHETSCD